MAMNDEEGVSIMWFVIPTLIVLIVLGFFLYDIGKLEGKSQGNSEGFDRGKKNGYRYGCGIACSYAYDIENMSMEDALYHEIVCLKSCDDWWEEKEEEKGCTHKLMGDRPIIIKMPYKE